MNGIQRTNKIKAFNLKKRVDLYFWTFYPAQQIEIATTLRELAAIAACAMAGWNNPQHSYGYSDKVVTERQIKLMFDLPECGLTVLIAALSSPPISVM